MSPTEYLAKLEAALETQQKTYVAALAGGFSYRAVDSKKAIRKLKWEIAGAKRAVAREERKNERKSA